MLSILKIKDPVQAEGSASEVLPVWFEAMWSTEQTDVTGTHQVYFKN